MAKKNLEKDIQHIEEDIQPEHIKQTEEGNQEQPIKGDLSPCHLKFIKSL